MVKVKYFFHAIWIQKFVMSQIHLEYNEINLLAKGAVIYAPITVRYRILNIMFAA